MKRRYNIELADNGVIIRDLDNEDIVQVVEYSAENTPVYTDDKICREVGRMLLEDIEAAIEDANEEIVAYGAGFTVEYRAFGRKRETRK